MIRTVKLAALLAVLAAAAYFFYPPARMAALTAVGHSPVCPFTHAVWSKANIEETGRIEDRIFAASRLVREENGLELWDTPKGPFWIPKGNRFVLPFNLAEMERHVYGAGEHFIHPGDIVLDCGASDGDFTREALRAGAAKVVSIEIAPSSVECIRRNLAAEIAAGRVIVYPKGVWDKDETLTLNVDDTNFAANSVVIRPDSSHPAVAVPLTTIDRIVAELNLPKIDFIKMDIERAELSALKGAERTLRAFKPTLAISVYHREEDLMDIPAYLNGLELGYEFLLDHFTIYKSETVLFAHTPES